MTLFLVRHGETTWNRDGTIQGWADSSLTARGRRQARAVGERLAADGVDRLVVSDLQRTRETAAALGEAGVDVAPTLLDSLGHPDAIPTTGTSLSTPPPEGRVLLTEAARYGHEKKAVYRNEWKLLASKGDDRAVGFRVPEEEPVQLPGSVERHLTEALPAWPDGDRPGQQVSGVARDRLEDLGYV